MHARLHYSPLDFKQLFEDRLFVAKFRSYNNIFAFMPMGSSLAEDALIDEQLANPQEKVYIFRVQKKYDSVGTLIHVESENPSFAQF